MTINWILEIEPWRLAFGPRPQSGDGLTDAIDAWASSGVKHVVSLLGESEANALGLIDEEKVCRARGIEFHSFPIIDHEVPDSIDCTSSLVLKLAQLVRGGEPVYVHCRAGIGRSGLVAAGILLHLGYAFEDTFPMLSFARGIRVPDTGTQIDWVESYARSLGVTE